MVHLFVIPGWVNVLFTCAVLGVALWRGDGRTRTISGVIVICQDLDLSVCHVVLCDLHPSLILQHALVTDTVVLAVCLACVLRAERYWVVVAAAFALLALVSDLAAFVPGVSGWAWASASLIWSYMLQFTLLWGVWTVSRDRARAAAA